MGLAWMEAAEEILEQEWTVEGIPVLSARLSLPRPTAGAGRKVLHRLERYYRQFGASYLRYCQEFLYPQAAAAFAQAAAVGAPLPQFSAKVSHRVTWNENGLWSLYLDAVERGGVPLTVRRGDTWDLSTGTPVPLVEFFPGRTSPRKLLPALATEEIQRQTEAGNAVYREDWRKLVRRAFSGGNYYLTPEGLCFFYQMYALAPAAEGVVVFSVPWEGGGVCLPQRFAPVPAEETP